MVAKTRTWFIPTSPRSPYKIQNEFKLFSKFEGVDWNKRGEAGNYINQIKFAQLLKKSDFFEGDISDTNPDFSGRERCRPIWMLGFAYKDENKVIKITPAGDRLLNNDRLEQLFLKQLLKLQFPSWQHGGMPTHAWRYPTERMECQPFIETIRVVMETNGVTKYELAMFLLPALNKEDFDCAIEKIKEFREGLKEIKNGKKPKNEYIFDCHLKEFRQVYSEDIENGEISTRETTTKTIRDFLLKKRRNSLDYADAVRRYFMYTGMFTLSGNKLIISPERCGDAERLLSELNIDVVPFYNNLEEFYNYLGDPELPSLPWETVTELEERINNIKTKIESIRNEINIIDSNYTKEALRQFSVDRNVKELSKYESYLLTYQFEIKKDLFEQEMKRQDRMQEIINYYPKIVEKDVIAPAIDFEWNTWRAMLALGDGNVVPNLKLDNELQPLDTAGGGVSDLEVYYEFDGAEYVLLIEVTLSDGKRQYDTESEPVTRHVAEFQGETKKDVFSLFIAPKINENTPEYFHLYFQDRMHPAAEDYITIIPITLDYFISFLEFCNQKQCFDAKSFYQLLEDIDKMREQEISTSKEWHRKIYEKFEGWKELHK